MGRPHSERLVALAEQMEACAARDIIPDSHQEADDLLIETIEVLYDEQRVPRTDIDRILVAYRNVLRWFS